MVLFVHEALGQSNSTKGPFSFGSGHSGKDEDICTLWFRGKHKRICGFITNTVASWLVSVPMGWLTQPVA